MSDDCECDQCRLARLLLEFKRSGADPMAILSMVADVIEVLYEVELVTFDGEYLNSGVVH